MTTGATVWKKLTAVNLTGTANAFGGQLLHVREVQNSGTAGSALTTATWNTRPLTTIVTNEISGATLAASVIALPAGTYFIDAALPIATTVSAFLSPAGTETDRPRLYNSTGTATLVSGVNASLAVAIAVQGVGSASTVITTTSTRQLRGRFTLAGTSNIILQHYFTSAGVTTTGVAATTGESEVYSDVLIWKVL